MFAGANTCFFEPIRSAFNINYLSFIYGSFGVLNARVNVTRLIYLNEVLKVFLRKNIWKNERTECNNNHMALKTSK